eukprot:scaffold5084_cov100-Cylindrotheca_fusiformis.AAC.2
MAQGLVDTDSPTAFRLMNAIEGMLEMEMHSPFDHLTVILISPTSETTGDRGLVEIPPVMISGSFGRIFGT